MSCVHMATLGFLATSLTQNIWIINAWLITLRMGVHGRTNFKDKIHQIQIQILQCGILQLLFASNIVLLTKHKYSVKCGVSEDFLKWSLNEK